jgi:hypothetical protein
VDAQPQVTRRAPRFAPSDDGAFLRPGENRPPDEEALSHQPFLLLITCLTARLGFNKFNGLGGRQDAAREPILARCDNAHRHCRIAEGCRGPAPGVLAAARAAFVR